MSNATREAETGLLSALKAVTWVVYVLVSAAEIFLVFMFVLQLLGANANQAFVAFIYRWGGMFARPFNGIFPSTDLGKVGFIDWNAVVAFAAYAVLAWVIGLALGAVRRQMWRDRRAEMDAAGSQPTDPNATGAPKA